MRRPNDDGPTDANGSTTTRRRYLAGLAAAGSVAIAGCGGGGGGDDGGGSDDDGSEAGDGAGADDTGGEGTGDTGGDTGGEGSGGTASCGPTSISYRTAEFVPTGGDTPVATASVPEDASVSINQYDENAISFSWGDSDPEFTYAPSLVEGTTIEDYESGTQFDDKTEITDQFELAVEGTRVFKWGSEVDFPEYTDVYVPAGDADTLVVGVRPDSVGDCLDASRPAYQELVGSSQPL